MYIFHRSTEDICPRDDVFDTLCHSRLHHSFRRGEYTLPASDYKECHVAGVGVEGEDIVFVRAGCKAEYKYYGAPVFFRLSDTLEQYINQHLDTTRIFQCNPDYPVWADGSKVAKVIFSKDKKAEYGNTVRIYEQVKELGIPLPKLLDHCQVSPTAAVVIMEYVGPDFDRFESPKYVFQPGERELKEEVDRLMERIEELGYRVDGAYRNFCLHNGRVVAIDWPNWEDHIERAYLDIDYDKITIV